VAAAGRFEAAFGAALDEDLNAPQALGALFDLVREGNRLLDAREPPGARMQAAWDLAERVLGVATPVRSVTLAGSLTGGAAAAADRTAGWTEAVPEAPSDRERWARHWAGLRLEAKGRRDYAEADRIRGFLGAAGFEVRDRKDGAVEVVPRGS
jgi:cysteinyl-tRNA synthetase